MRRNRLEDADFSAVAQELNVPVTEVRRAVYSFFGEIVVEARALPFNTEKKIFSKGVFDQFLQAWNLPFIGRIGPVYSRYLKWRSNEAKNIIQEPRSNYRSRITQDEIENMADDILSGRTPSPVRKKRGNEMYNRVWLVGQGGKRLARQVIPKQNEDVQD